MMYNNNMKNIGQVKRFWFAVFLFLTLFAFSNTTFASLPAESTPQKAAPCVAGAGKICNPIAATTVQDFIKFALTGVLKLGIPVVALAIIYSGFLFVIARGNPEALSKAKDTLLYTLIGAAILLGAWSIAQLISATITTIGS